MKGMRWRRRVAGEQDEYVSREEFVGIFESEQAGLRRLALLLTANADTADQCLRLALRQCTATGFVLKGWALIWARRVVVRNAISLMKSGQQSFAEANGDADKELLICPEGRLPGPVANDQQILRLPEFDRFVFVICVLERYSVRDCAVLLGTSLRDISDARQRASRQLDHRDDVADRSAQVTMR